MPERLDLNLRFRIGRWIESLVDKKKNPPAFAGYVSGGARLKPGTAARRTDFL